MPLSKEPRPISTLIRLFYLLSAAIIALPGCAEHDSALAYNPFTAIFTKTYIPQSTSSSAPTLQFGGPIAAIRTKLDHAIEKAHGHILLSSGRPDLITFFIDSAPDVTPNSIRDPDTLVNSMRSGTEPLPTYIWSRFDERTKQAIYSAQVNTTAASRTSSMQAAMADGLNEIVSGPSIYKPGLFNNAKLRDETRGCLNEGIRGDATAKCNLLLLEDALPNNLTTKSSLYDNIRRAPLRRYITDGVIGVLAED